MSAAFSIGFLFRNMKEFKELKNWLDDYCKNEKFSCISLISNREIFEKKFETAKNTINMDSDDF
jgi:hypothetical protein